MFTRDTGLSGLVFVSRRSPGYAGHGTNTIQGELGSAPSPSVVSEKFGKDGVGHSGFSRTSQESRRGTAVLCWEVLRRIQSPYWFRGPFGRSLCDLVLVGFPFP